MRLDLREIINIPGGTVSFDCLPDVSELDFPSVTGFTEPLRAVGTVRNTAGVLMLKAVITAKLRCTCARCLREFEKDFRLDTEAVLVTEAQDKDDPDLYILDGDCVDVDEVVITAFVLNLDQRILCSEDCKGLCEKCGKNLNDGPCSCRAESDPRFAVLGQLLENE
jgi:uncharacterized protein